MKKFSDWLEASPGMQKKLAEKVGTNKTGPSLVKTERRPIPRRWIPIVVDMSGGLLSTEDLLQWSLSVSARLKRERSKASTRA